MTQDEAEEIEKRHETEGENLYMLQAAYEGKRVVFDATYRSNSLGRLINHSKKGANLLLRKPIEVRGKLRIGFIAKRDIQRNEELLFDYCLESYSRAELPAWYSETPAQRNDESEEGPGASKPPLRLKKCQVPGCGATIKRMWNHIHSSVHKDLSR